jgi:hypothetical protein
MTFAIALLLLTPAPPPAVSPEDAPARPRSLLQQIVPHPTGQNGYEEFLAAADLLGAPEVRDAIDRATRARTDLALARRAARLALPAFALVRQGLLKPVFDPRQTLEVDTLFPEFAAFRQLARAYQLEVWVRFADGEPRAGVRAAVEGLRFSRAISRSLLIADLVSMACEAIMFGALDRHIAHVPEPDVALLTGLVEEVLAGEPHWVGVFTREAEFVKSGLAMFLEGPGDPVDPEAFDAGLLEPPPPEVEAFRSATPAQKAAVKRDFATHMGLVLDELRERSAKPEAQWLTPSGNIEAADPVVRYVAESATEVFEHTVAFHARTRTQYRLLRLHAAITQFRWRHHRLPRDLAELGQPAWLEDPLSGGQFQYRPTGGMEYELYSRGAGDMGRIDLRYVRPLAPQDAAPGQP